LSQLILALAENNADVSESFESLLNILKHNHETKFSFAQYLKNIFLDKNYIRLFTETGIMENDPFLLQVRRAIWEKFLPEPLDRNDATSALKRILSTKKHIKIFNQIPINMFSELFFILNFKEIYQHDINSEILEDALNAIQVLSIRLSSLGFAPEILKKLPELEKYDSPFMSQTREIGFLIENFHNPEFDRSSKNNDYRHVIMLLDQCHDYIELIKKRKHAIGISFKLTNYLIRMNQFLKRLRMLLYLVTTHKDERLFQEEILLLKILVNSLTEQNSIRTIIHEHSELVSKQIIDNTSETGEAYITRGFSDYLKMLLSSCGGGFIVAFLTIFKVSAYYLGWAPLGTAFLYSMNYSFGFMFIHITNSKLATKQPAMTASTLASALDQEIKEDKNLIDFHIEQLSEFVIQLFRSQLIAFTGNVIIALPIAYSIVFILQYYFQYTVANETKALQMIAEIHPWKSLSLFHAAIAGVYLFLSGVISGYYDNLAINIKLAERMKNQNMLRKILPKKMLINFSNYISDHLGQLSGNFFLGVFLGVTSTIGMITGLPLDIRHITFAAGNLGIAMATGGFENVSHYTFMISIAGILAIGAVNFLVSFGISFFIAARSKQLKFRYSRILINRLLLKVMKNPLKLLLPPLHNKNITDPPV
jgi:site-specific recombinase